VKNILLRIWTGIVAATAGASIGLVVVVILTFMQVDLRVSIWVVAILMAIGMAFGVTFGNLPVPDRRDADRNTHGRQKRQDRHETG